jgi:rhodanese-related sulfurtransferase
MGYLRLMIKHWKTTINLMLHRSVDWSEITVEDLLERINSNEPPLILDIRSTEDYNGADGHIPNSKSIPILELSSNLKDLQSYIYDYKENEIVTICPGGGLSLVAVDILVDAEFKDVKSLKGGLDLWCQKGYPITTS